MRSKRYLSEVVQEMVSRSECREIQGYAHEVIALVENYKYLGCVLDQLE